MKPQSFEYARPGDLADVYALLDRYGDEAKVLAGGQSLVPMMNLRLARPALLVDLNALARPAAAGATGAGANGAGADGAGADGAGADGAGTALSRLRREGAALRAGALVRHRTLAELAGADPLASLLARTARRVAHPPIRNRGTLCGSLAHADPAAEWSLVGLALDARVVVGSSQGVRELSVDALLDGPFSTTLRPTEVILEAVFPALAPPWGGGLAELARTAGSFAELAACAVLGLAAGRVDAARVAVAGTQGRPVLLAGTAEALRGQRADAALVGRAGDAVRGELAGAADGHRREVLAALVEDAVGEALREVARWEVARWSST
ncbi:MAG: FAD binding domain-containing protein [Actinomycetota bacterium]